MKFAYWASLLLLTHACAINRAPSQNLLERRADFKGMHEVEEALGAVDNPLLVPVRTEPQVADIWVHPHELPNGDYFRGAWIRTVVSSSSWSMEGRSKPLLVGKDLEEVGESEKDVQGSRKPQLRL